MEQMKFDFLLTLGFLKPFESLISFVLPAVIHEWNIQIENSWKTNINNVGTAII